MLRQRGFSLYRIFFQMPGHKYLQMEDKRKTKWANILEQTASVEKQM